MGSLARVLFAAIAALFWNLPDSRSLPGRRCTSQGRARAASFLRRRCRVASKGAVSACKGLLPPAHQSWSTGRGMIPTGER